MGDTDKVLAKTPGGLKTRPPAWERWRAVTWGPACYCICSVISEHAEPSRARSGRGTLGRGE